MNGPRRASTYNEKASEWDFQSNAAPPHSYHASGLLQSPFLISQCERRGRLEIEIQANLSVRSGAIAAVLMIARPETKLCASIFDTRHVRPDSPLVILFIALGDELRSKVKLLNTKKLKTTLEFGVVSLKRCGIGTYSKHHRLRCWIRIKVTL